MESYIVQLDFSAAFDRVGPLSLIQIEIYWCRWQCAVHLLAVVRKPAERPAVAALLNMDLANIQELCNHWHDTES